MLPPLLIKIIALLLNVDSNSFTLSVAPLNGAINLRAGKNPTMPNNLAIEGSLQNLSKYVSHSISRNAIYYNVWEEIEVNLEK